MSHAEALPTYSSPEAFHQNIDTPVSPQSLVQNAQELYDQFTKKDTSFLSPESKAYVEQQINALKAFLSPETLIQNLVDNSLEHTQQDLEMTETVNESEAEYKTSTAETLKNTSGVLNTLAEKIPNIKESFLSLVMPLFESVKDNSVLAIASVFTALAAKGNIGRILALTPILGKIGAEAFPNQVESVMKWMGKQEWVRDIKEWGLLTILKFLNIDATNPSWVEKRIIDGVEMVTDVDLDGDREEYQDTNTNKNTSSTPEKKEKSTPSFLEHISSIFLKKASI